MKAKDVMTSPVLSVELDTSVLEAIQIMLQKRISGLPVRDKGGNLVGIITEGDFLRRGETGTERRRSRWLELLVGPGRLADEYTHAHGRRVGDVMTGNVITATEDSPLEVIVNLMERYQIKRVPILERQHLVGIITRANLLHALAALSHEAPPNMQTDENIRNRLLEEFAKQKWSPLAPRYINPVVRNGVVELWGTIDDERERRAIIVAAENVAGTKEVRDHMILIDPVSGWIIKDAG